MTKMNIQNFFIEFVPDGRYQPFDYDKTYTKFIKVAAIQDSDLFKTDVVGVNMRVNHLDEFYLSFNKAELVKEVPNYYKVDMYYGKDVG